MKVLMKNPDLCIRCHACESKCSGTWFKEDNIKKSCIRIEDQDISVCSQCGECINICPVEAIYRDKTGVVRIKKDICVGCFMCVGYCPELSMRMHDDYTEPFKCIACGQCASICPTGAIHLKLEGGKADE
jgi:Fe-S-cluster-containing hydrogenase component 2